MPLQFLQSFQTIKCTLVRGKLKLFSSKQNFAIARRIIWFRFPIWSSQLISYDLAIPICKDLHSYFCTYRKKKTRQPSSICISMICNEVEGKKHLILYKYKNNKMSVKALIITSNLKGISNLQILLWCKKKKSSMNRTLIKEKVRK